MITTNAFQILVKQTKKLIRCWAKKTNKKVSILKMCSLLLIRIKLRNAKNLLITSLKYFEINSRK